MKKARFTESQFVAAIKKQEGGISTCESAFTVLCSTNHSASHQLHP